MNDEKKDVVINIAVIIIAAIAIFFLIGFLMGCNPEAKKLRKTQEYLFRHPDYSAAYCAEQYPVKDSVIVRDSVSFDTLYVDYSVVDTVINMGETVYITREIPVIKTITKTVYRDSIVYRRDAAEERRLNLSLQYCQANNNTLLNNYNEQKADLASWKGKAKKRLWWVLILIGAVAGYGLIKLKNNLPIKFIS